MGSIIPLAYTWYVNEEKVGEGNTLDYTFESKEPHIIKCVITNEIGGVLEISKTTNVADSVYIVDISEIKNRTLMGDYTFTVKAADALGKNLNYSWLVNGVEKSTSSTLTISFLKDTEIVNIKCLISNINGNATYEKTTEIYYPEPILLSSLQNLSTAQGNSQELYVQAINANEIKNDSLQYTWYVDNVLVQANPIEGEWYTYAQADNIEHTIKCVISNSYKSATTQSRMGNISATAIVIKSLEGNLVKVHDGNITTVYDINNSGQVAYFSTSSSIDVSAQFTQETVLTPLLFARLYLNQVIDTTILTEEKRIAVTNFASQRSILLNDKYPNLYNNSDVISTMSQNANTNQDEYLDIDEIYMAGLALYDTNSDNKIQMKELRTYDDNNVTLNLAILKKDLVGTLIDLSESVFNAGFDNLPARQFSISPYFSKYPDNEYITPTIILYNAPELVLGESESRIFSPGNPLDFLEASHISVIYDSATQKYSGEYKLRIHHPNVEDQNISFLLANTITHESYFVHDVNFSSPISIDYALFTAQESFEVSKKTLGKSLVVRDNKIYQAGTITYDYYSDSSGNFVRYDSTLAKQFGVYFNLENTVNISPQSTSIDTLYFYAKIFNVLHNSNPLLEQYLSVKLTQDISNSYDMTNIEIGNDDLQHIDKLEFVYHDSFRDYNTTENKFTYIYVEELAKFKVKPTNIHFTSLDDASCIAYFGASFCEIRTSEYMWNLYTKIKAIDYVDSSKYRKRIKTWIYNKEPN
jgi:hypothetical protein